MVCNGLCFYVFVTTDCDNTRRCAPRLARRMISLFMIVLLILFILCILIQIMILILLCHVIKKFNTVDDYLLIIRRTSECIREEHSAFYDNTNTILETIKNYCSRINININNVAKHLAIVDTKINNKNKAKNSYTNSNMNNTARNKKSFNRKLKIAKINNISTKQRLSKIIN